MIVPGTWRGWRTDAGGGREEEVEVEGEVEEGQAAGAWKSEAPD